MSSQLYVTLGHFANGARSFRQVSLFDGMFIKSKRSDAMITFRGSQTSANRMYNRVRKIEIHGSGVLTGIRAPKLLLSCDDGVCYPQERGEFVTVLTLATSDPSLWDLQDMLIRCN